MPSILDRVADSFSHFTPTKSREYLALQLAKKLNDEKAFRHYLVLFEHYPEELLVDIYHRCQGDGSPTGERFIELLRERTQ